MQLLLEGVPCMKHYNSLKDPDGNAGILGILNLDICVKAHTMALQSKFLTVSTEISNSERAYAGGPL